MYESCGEYLQCGDVFAEVPIPIVTVSLPPDVRLEYGPALLVDGDCSIDKPLAEAFNFAPIYSLDGIRALDRGNVRANHVRRFFYLAPDPIIGTGEFYADLQELFSLPRDLFACELVTLAARETRIRLTSDSGTNRRRASLTPEAVRSLKVQLADFLDLRETAGATEP